MLDLFSAIEEGAESLAGELRGVTLRNLARAPGAMYVPEFVTPEEERALIAHVDAGEWSHEYERRRQHYGVRYDLEQPVRIGPLPGWLHAVAERLAQAGFFAAPPDQALINEYLPGQGISAHVDRSGGIVASLSLGSGCVMELARGDEQAPLWLEPRSLLVLTGEARFEWTHGIARRRRDRFAGHDLARTRRVSLTFRGAGAEG